MLAAVVVGCSGTAPDPQAKGEAKTPEQVSTGQEPAKTSLADIPAELKHAGFDYYGLGHGKPVNMISRVQGQPDKTGSAELVLVEVKDGKAEFEQTFSGDLGLPPSSKLIVTKDGVYSTALGSAPLENPQLELPADAAPGKSWKLQKPFDAGGSKVTKFDSKIVGMEKVTVPLGTYDALKVIADVVMEQGSTKRTAKMTAWYAKGMGTVKLSMEVNDGAKTSVQTLLATK